MLFVWGFLPERSLETLLPRSLIVLGVEVLRKSSSPGQRGREPSASLPFTN